MNIVNASFEYIPPFGDTVDGVTLLKACEMAGRLCYASSNKISETSYERFIKAIIMSGHTSVLEHASIGVILKIDRGVTHELVRHRHTAYSMESTRWCLYSADKFNGQITFVRPVFWMDDSDPNNKTLMEMWEKDMYDAEAKYMDMIERGAKAEQARGVLPHSIKANIAVTANLREWRQIFALRCAKDSHPQMREIMLLLLDDFYTRVPVVFDDIYEKYKDDIAFIHKLRKD